MASEWQGMNWIRRRKRLAIYIRDGFRCAYCLLDLRDAGPAEIQLDHLIPRSAGGDNGATNLITACRTCNSSRGARPLVEWLAVVISRFEWVNEHPTIRKYQIETQAARALNYTLADQLLAGDPAEAEVPTGPADCL